MSTRRTLKDYERALVEADGHVERAAAILGVTSRQVGGMKNQLRAAGIKVPIPPRNRKPDLVFPKLPERERPLEELLEARRREYGRFKDSEESRAIITVRVTRPGPIGINLQGDPHLDDPGCDIEAVERDCRLVKETEGLYAGSIGDLQNLWIGRLARLHSKQTTTDKEAWKLVEWYVKSCKGKWLFLIKGNHDLWAGGSDPLDWIAKHAGGPTEAHQVRFALTFPNGREVRITARHSFPGKSMWNPSHGQLRNARMVYHDHILVGGHHHAGSYQRIYNEGGNLVSHCIQLGSYKVYDDYRNENGFPRTQTLPSVTAVIDPAARLEANLVQIFDDTARAADYLTHLRKKAA